MSIALEVARLVEVQMGTHPGRLLKVGIEIGDDAGVEPDNLEFCLEAVLSHPPFSGAKPVLARVAGEVLRLDFLEVDDGRPDD